MNVIGFSGLANSIPFKRKEFPGLTEREYNIVQGLDAAAALLGAQGIVAAAGEERFTRQKATGDFPINAFNFCLAAGKLKPADIDIVAHGFAYEPHQEKFQKDDYARRQYAKVFSPQVQRELLKKNFVEGRWDEKLVCVPHHLAHAASAFYPSGFEEALILVSDGMGEMESMTVAAGQGRDIKVLAQVPSFHSLGTLYGVFSLYLGFFMNSDEYKVMGLAPYGNPRRYFDKLMEFVSLKEDGTYTLPIFAHNQTLEERETHRGVVRFLTETFGPARDPESELTQAHKDLAAGLQSMLQTVQLHVLRHFKRETGLKNLCMAGGVALNCSANGVIKRSELFKRVFVEPASGDDGSALGAALYASRLHDTQFKPKKLGVPLWGSEFTEAEIRQAVEGRTDCDVVEVDSFTEVCNEVTARLARGEIIAWFQGRMEFGPRALGSRSIIADPRDATMRDRINALVKKREAFRPFAPVVTREAAAEIFEIPPGDEEAFAHMLFVTHVRPEYKDKLPATTHVDGSARVQTVAQEENPKLWQLLNAFAAATGTPVLLNTSFNVRGQPIVRTPVEAVDTFLKAKLDALVLGHLLVLPRQIEAEDPAKTEEKRRLREETAARHEEFWVNRLAALEPVSVPLKRKELAGEVAQKSDLASEGISKGLLTGFGKDAKAEEVALAALGVWLARTTGMQTFDLSFTDARLEEKVAGLETQFASVVPYHAELDLSGTFADAIREVRMELAKLRSRGAYFLDLPLRNPALKNINGAGLKLPVGVRFSNDTWRLDGSEVTLTLGENGDAKIAYDSQLLEDGTVCGMAQQITNLLENLRTDPAQPLSKVSLLSEAEQHLVLREWNSTKRDNIPSGCIHEFFAQQVEKTPQAIALAFQEEELTYAELDRRASEVAAELKKLGVGPDTMVAVCTEVCLEMMIGLLGVLKAGGAYVPLDPNYPADRLAFMLEDSKAPVLLTQKRLVNKLPTTEAKVVCLEDFNFDSASVSKERGSLNSTNQDPASLAYVIYTSGSTGKPKGVMITHANVANFFAGMDERVGVDPKGVWLAVTSISFDISVLELFWTLVRGFKVVLQSRETRASAPARTASPRKSKAVDFSLFYFASDESASGAQKYRLLLEGAKFADAHEFAAVWTPERHFHAFGGLYPNPSVTSAAVAAVTNRVQIRAGSVVLPLHNPVRVAEEWSVVDNLSNGRVGISFASGWQINDFALAPDNFTRRKEAMLEGIELIRKLWRGEAFDYKTPKGASTPLKVLPRPVQKDLPIWLTASGNPETFKQAGQLGANVLTHLLGQSLDELKEKINVYRTARKEAGHEGPGSVTLMLHTFVGDSLEAVKETVRGPFTAYLRSSIDLIKNDPWAFSTFKPAAKVNGNGHPADANGPAKWNDEERDALAAHAFNRYFETSGLFGTPDRCVEMVEKMQSLGVDEVACLIDFGVNEDEVLASLNKLNEVRQRASVERSTLDASQYSVAAQMVRHGVTHLQCTPSMASMLLEDPNAVEAVGSLKKLLLGGEALPLSLVQQLQIKAEILNMYGPTETTIWSATDTVKKTENRVTIGRPIANTEIYIVDKFLQPTPPGVPGELLIGGLGVVRGYLHRPELTSEKFIPDPFRGTPGARLYRTGDLARHLPDGRVEFLGRLDHQVKLRGFRIELGEIETVIARHSSVKECVAIVREDKPGDKRLVAYVIPSGGAAPEIAALREHARGSLPEHMVPSAFVFLPSFPHTPNGKVDRKAFPAPSFQWSPAKLDVAHGSPTEQKVAEIYRELLGVELRSFQDNFFELGGNSLLATQLVTRLREAFQWQLPLRLAFEYPTVQSLAVAISQESQRNGDGQNAPETIEAGGRSGPLPLSFAQQRIWFLHQLEPGSHYNDHFDLRLTGPVDTKALERAINEIVRRHDALRSTFRKGETGPILDIQPEVELRLKTTDLSSLPLETREEKATQLAVQDCQQPFDLETGPLLRAGLVKLHEQDHLLALTFDHIVIDGWSHGVFLTELTSIYEAFLAGKPSPLPPLPVQYTDYAGWQQNWFQGKNIEPHLAYWRKQLADAPALLELPTDHPRPVVESFRGARHFFELEKPLVDGLATVGRKESCTLFMVLLAAFQTLLSKYTDREDIILGSPIANRNRAETEGLIGSFMNTLVLRGDLRGDPTFTELLHRVRKMSLDSYAHQDLPFEQLVADLQPERNLGYSPVFQVMFILQNTPAPKASVGGLSFQHFDVDAGSSKLDITLNLEETKDGAVGWIEYATDLFEAESIKHMASHFKELLKGIAANPNERLSQLPMAPKGEQWRFPSGKSGNRTLANQNASVSGLSAAGHPSALGVPALELPKSVKPPLSKVQGELAAIWGDVLGIEGIAADDNLFDLGGHSLLITRIISRIRKSFGVELPIHAFFETPTLGGIATAIETEQAKGPGQKSSEPGIRKLARR